MNRNPKGINTICTHVGELKDEQYKGAISPIFMSSSYAFEDVDKISSLVLSIIVCTLMNKIKWWHYDHAETDDNRNQIG